jgi:hypothetical protein
VGRVTTVGWVVQKIKCLISTAVNTMEHYILNMLPVVWFLMMLEKLIVVEPDKKCVPFVHLLSSLPCLQQPLILNIIQFQHVC